MFLAKTYAGHTSFINQIELGNDQNYLFTTGIEDECLIKWKIGFEVKIP